MRLLRLLLFFLSSLPGVTADAGVPLAVVSRPPLEFGVVASPFVGDFPFSPSA